MLFNKQTILMTLIALTLSASPTAFAQLKDGQLALEVQAPRPAEAAGYEILAGEQMKFGSQLALPGMFAFQVILDDGRSPEDSTDFILVRMQEVQEGQYVSETIAAPKEAAGHSYFVRAVHLDKLGTLWTSEMIRVTVRKEASGLPKADAPSPTRPVSGPLSPSPAKNPAR